MRYIGSKTKLLEYLSSAVDEKCKIADGSIFCDIFAGTGIVGRTFKTSVKKVISNDVEYYI